MAFAFPYRTALALLGLLPCALATAHAAEPPARPLPAAATREIDFVNDIEPIFATHCYHCHGADEQQGRLRLDAKLVVFAGGNTGPAVLPGKSGDSLIVHRLAGLGEGPQMPTDSDPLSDEDIGLTRAWIDQGAKWPDGVSSPAAEVPKHWAYVAPVRPATPAVQDAAWSTSTT